MRALRPLLRLAIRDARRDRWRSLLVLVTVALPVAGLVAAATLTDTGYATAEENAVAAMGRADVVAYAAPPDEGGPADEAAMLAELGELPAGTEVEAHRRVAGATAVDGLSVPVAVVDAPLGPEALAAGQRQLLDGVGPTSGDAVSVSSALLDRVDLAVGDTVPIEPLGEVTVVGVHRAPEHLSRLEVVVRAGSLAGRSDAAAEVLVDLPDGVDTAQLEPEVAFGSSEVPEVEPTFWGRTRSEVSAERFSQGERSLFIIVGGLAAVEVALVAGAAFAVSVRRRQRELGLLAATGGTRAHVRRSVLLLGLSVGVVGGAVGVLLGLGASAGALPLVSASVDRVVTGLRVDAVWILGSAALGVVAAVVGAWWPARSVARLPLLTALSGRRPTPAPASKGLVTGLVLVALGVGLCLAGSGAFGGNAFGFLAGSVAVVLGAGMTAPWLLEQLGRLARFLPAGPRLAVRDAARFRTRNGPIVTAAMAGLAASVTIAAVITSIDAREEAAYTPSLPDDVLLVHDAGVRGAAEAVGAAIGRATWTMTYPGLAVVEPARGTGPRGEPTFEHANGAIVAPEVATALAGEAAGADLAAGRAVNLRDTGLTSVELRPTDAATGELGEALATFPVAVHEAGLSEDTGRLPQLLLPDAPQARAAIAASPDAWTEHVVVLDGPVDEETFRTATRAAARVGPEVMVAAERGYQSPYATLRRVATVVGGLAGLLIVAVAIALAAAESRADLRTLTAVGAGRRTRRSLAAGRALLLSGLGALLAVPVGLLPTAALLSTLVGRPPLVLPWPTLGVVLVLVPLLATAGAVLASRREPAGLTRVA